MNIKQFYIFKEVAKTNNFTKAAQHLFLTQSAISHAIRELEEEVECQLFERLHKSVRLTTSGQLLLNEILPILEEIEKLESKKKNLEKSTPIHIATCITIGHIYLPKIIQKFKTTHSDVNINVKIVSASKALELLKLGKVDLALIEGVIPPSNYLIEPLNSYTIGVFASKDYPIEKRITLNELLRHPLLLRERGSAVREIFESFLVLNGHKVFPCFESVDSMALIEASKTKLGLCILPHILVDPQCKLIELKVEGLNLSNPVHVVMNRNIHKTSNIKAFLNLINQELGSHTTDSRCL